MAILTDDKGQQFERPQRSSYASDVDFVRAYHAYKQRVTNAANAAFDSELRRK